MSSRVEESGTVSKRGKPGKRQQTWTQRQIARADRAAPNRTIIIHRDGSIELRPVGESVPTKEENEWDGVR